MKVESVQRVSHGGTGVFEIAARVSAIDLSDRDIRGGSESDITRRELVSRTKVKLAGNYIHVDATPSSVRLDCVEADILVGRLQLFSGSVTTLLVVVNQREGVLLRGTSIDPSLTGD